LLVTRLAGIGSAQQVIAVVAGGYGTGTATVSAYDRGANGWRQVFGPWPAFIGRNGVAPIGAKREGDGRTPSGVFGFDFMFGIDPDPGVHFPFRRITGANIVWDDDPASTSYNEWVDTNVASAGADPEPMDSTPSYLYGAVIAYNDARTPGLGSAIFLHVSHGSSTAGCVSLPFDELLTVLRWLDPARSPRIAIGTLATLE
jgi:L,D-peptidoglycan transpeptidase YkuD (ErfK/YbiS/YcfS/YnhG family)